MKATASKPDFLSILGPGVITGASDDDPSGIGTYSAIGARFGYSLLWTPLFTYPLMAAVQFICAKIGIVTKEGLAGVLKEHYPNWLLWFCISLLIIANTINAAADIGAIAAAINLLAPQVAIQYAVVPVTLILLCLLIFKSYKFIENTFKWLTLSLFTYIVAAFFCKPDMGLVITNTLIPHFEFSKEYLEAFVAILGTTISPYLFFWQTSQEVEEARHHTSHAKPTKSGLSFTALDVNLGMFLSTLVMYFIILTTASTLHASGTVQIESAVQAAKALEPLAGDFAKWLFALGLIGTGCLAVPILVGSSSYALAELLNWKRGLDEKWYKAKAFYSFIVTSSLIAVLIDLSGINPMRMLYIAAITNGLLAPPLLFLIMLISNNKNIMGTHSNSNLTNILGWLATLVMTIAALTLLATQLFATG